MGFRVLFLSRHLGPAGTTSHLIALANGLQKAGCKVAIASQQHGKHDSTDSFTKLGIPCYEINFPPPYRTFAENINRLWKTASELTRATDEFQPHIVHVQWRSLTPFAQFLKLLRRIPFVTTLNVESIPS